MTAKEYLSKYRSLMQEIEVKGEKIKRLDAQAQYVSPRIGANGNGDVSDKVGNLTAELIDEANVLNGQIAELKAMREDIERQIAGIEDDRYRLILEGRYMLGLQWDGVVKLLRINDRKWVFKLHGRALQLIKPPE